MPERGYTWNRFGGKKIPELAKGIGQGIRSFKTALKEAPSAAEIEKA
jgi:Sec-independent protein translocase protein TatA